MNGVIRKNKIIRRIIRVFLILFGSLGVVYISAILLLAARQRHLIYRPQPHLSMLPSSSEFGLPYKDVWIPAPKTSEVMHGWWIPATTERERYVILPQEPTDVLASPKVMLYLCGVGNNMGDYNYLSRVSAFRQLGFSVLVFDYRGYGQSAGDSPKETQLYEDAQAAWNYLRQERQIPAEDIVIYGESLGGAIAIELATKQPDAGGLIVQSSFTSMLEAIQAKSFANLVPLESILTERFESLSKVGTLQIPVLFLHGTADSVVPSAMSERLYAAAPEPKQLFLIPDADHVSIYRPGEASYFRAIHRFTQVLSTQTFSQIDVREVSSLPEH